MKNFEKNLRVIEDCELENIAGGEMAPVSFGILTKTVY